MIDYAHICNDADVDEIVEHIDKKAVHVDSCGEKHSEEKHFELEVAADNILDCVEFF